jgi:antirestriction protein ArdC
VRKGEHSTVVVFWKFDEREDEETHETRKVAWAKSYLVFNACQVDGWKGEIVPQPSSEAERIATGEAFIAAQGADIRHGGSIACYVPSQDLIRLPHFTAFDEPARYYSTAAHELVHWTAGNEKRAPREKLAKRFGDAAYAMEELVAELGAAFVCSELGQANHPRIDHARYIEGWLRALKGDKRAIFTAAGKAQAAADYLMRNYRGDEVVASEMREAA